MLIAEQSSRPKASANAERRSAVLTPIALVIQRPTDLDPRRPAYNERENTAPATCDRNEAIKNRQDFSQRGAAEKSLLDGALRRGRGSVEAEIGVVGVLQWLTWSLH